MKCSKNKSYVFSVTLVFLVVSGCGGGSGDPSSKDYFSDARVRALSEAAAKGDTSQIDRLVDDGVDINTVGKEGMTPLSFALINNNKDGFLHLLKRGANPNLQNDDGDSVISLVAKIEDDSEWLEMVLKHKGDPNLVDSIDSIKSMKDITPLYRAIRSNNLRNVKLLIDAGSNVDHQNFRGTTPAMSAAGHRWYSAVHLLLEAGADVSIKDKYGQDLAFYCYHYGSPTKRYPREIKYYYKVLEVLKDKGVDINAAKKAATKTGD